MRVKIDLQCPYCGLKFPIELAVHEHFQLNGRPQICPDDQFEGACGNIFYYDVRLTATPMRYFVAPDVQASLDRQAELRGEI